MVPGGLRTSDRRGLIPFGFVHSFSVFGNVTSKDSDDTTTTAGTPRDGTVLPHSFFICKNLNNIIRNR